MEALDSSGPVLKLLGETGGAIGIICGLLLLAMFFFFRHLMLSVEARDEAIKKLTKQSNEALVNNASALSALTHTLQNRRCLATEQDEPERHGKTTVYHKHPGGSL